MDAHGFLGLIRGWAVMGREREKREKKEGKGREKREGLVTWSSGEGRERRENAKRGRRERNRELPLLKRKSRAWRMRK